MPDAQPWNPSEHALAFDVWVDPDDASPSAVMMRHPTAPFVRTVEPGDEADLELLLQEVARDYLALAFDRLKGLLRKGRTHPQGVADEAEAGSALLVNWLSGLRRITPSDADDSINKLCWLPGEQRGREANVELTSFQLGQTVVLLAGERIWDERGDQVLTGSEFGVRVVAHVRPDESGARSEVRITGMSASLPFGPWDDAGRWQAHPKAFSGKLYLTLMSQKMRIADALGLDVDGVFFRRLRLALRDEGETLQFEVQGTGFDKGAVRAPGSGFDESRLAHRFRVSGLAEKDGAVVLRSLHKVPLTADAGDAKAPRLFVRDPASQGGPEDLRKRRVTRSEKELDPYRTQAKTKPVAGDELTWTSSVAGRQAPIRELEVIHSPFVKEGRTHRRADRASRPGKNERKLIARRKAPPRGGLHIRSNAFAAESAYWNLGQLFARFDRYGIDPQRYFRIGRLPVRAAYRSGVHPGPGKDGQTVNARVTSGTWKTDFFGLVNADGHRLQSSGSDADPRPEIAVHFALANLSHRYREEWDGKEPAEAVPLGIAADPRWVWHEIGHVLLLGAVGELEFRFAHSAGDALAAIACDPGSDLATDARARGATFPWVFLPRRHDRCVTHGWSWSGSLHRPASLVADPERPRRRGYWSEQILSSSLFRLYRALGGDTCVPGTGGERDRAERELASHYVICLIIKAIGLLGPAEIVPAHRIDHFVSALIDADIGTDRFEIKVDDGTGNERTAMRVGGCAHKVIRWAFEAQGLYAPASVGLWNAAGSPPAVDIYIEDGRTAADPMPYRDAACDAGTYAPVSLDWGDGAKWHARGSAIRDDGNEIRVLVRNRGSEPATGVEVKLWWREKPDDPAGLQWDGGRGWSETAPQTAANAIAPGGEAEFGPFVLETAETGRTYLVLAEATCPDDRANTDTTTGLPCSRLATPLADLVSGDNNLGLRIVTIR